MNYAAMDLDSFGTILTLSLEEQGTWVEPLKYFKTQLEKVRVSPEHVLPDPLTPFTDELISVTFPTVIRKCLALGPLNHPQQVVMREFLAESLDFIACMLIERDCVILLHVLSDIFDPAQSFYVQNGRVNNSQWSQYLVTAGRIVCQNRTTEHLLRIIHQLHGPEAVESVDILSRISRVVSSTQEMFHDTEFAKDVFVQLIDYLSSVEDPKRIKHKDLLKVVPCALDICTHEDIVNAIKVAIMKFFFDVDLADIRIAGMRLATILFTKVEVFDEVSIDVFLGQASNYECLTIFKPILMKLGERRLMTLDLMENLWSRVEEQHATVHVKAMTLFCDVAIASVGLPEIIDIVKGPSTALVYGQLIKGRQFEYEATMRLLNMETNDGIRELLNAAGSTDLRFILPELMPKIQDERFVESAVMLLDKILEKYPQDMNTTSISDSVAAHFSKVENKNEIINALARILNRTGTTISDDAFASIAKLQSVMVYFVKQMFPLDRKPLVTDQACRIYLVDLIDSVSESEFEMIEHLYMNCDQLIPELAEKLSQYLWSRVLSSTTEALRKKCSSLLLEFQNPRQAPSLISDYIRRCLEEIGTQKGKEAAIFIRECLEKTASYVEMSKFGDVHKAEIADDSIDITIQIDGENRQVRIDKNLTVHRLITRVATDCGFDVASVAPYLHKSALKPECRICDKINQGDVVEVRLRREYKRSPIFTEENHPFGLFRDPVVVAKLQELLSSDIGEHIYDILIEIPTLEGFAVSKLNPDDQFLFAYQLQFLYKHMDIMENRKEIQKEIESILIEKSSSIDPEVRYLLIVLLDKETRNPELVNTVLYQLCKQDNPRLFSRCARKLWSIVGDFEQELDVDVLQTILSVEKKRFHETAISSKLIKSQAFDKIWKVFMGSSDKKKCIDIISNVEIPSDSYSVVFNELLPLFETLDEKLLNIFERITDQWDEFPPERIASILINGYIRCQINPEAVTIAPFKLLLSIMKRNENVRDEVVKILSSTMPTSADWGYVPGDSFKNELCGLKNLRSTCYVNAICQVLFGIPQLRRFFISENFYDNPELNAIHVLFTRLQHSTRKYIDMQEFALKWTGWDGMPIDPAEQQDANEFLMLLFTRLEGRWNDVLQLVSGEMETVLTGEGKHIDTHTETFNVLPLVVLGQNSIDDSLKVSSLPEVIDNYKPDGQDRAISINSVHRIKRLPPYLFIQLKRFEYSIETQTKEKIDQKYVFEDSFDFKPYYFGEDQETRYTLKGVVVHQGDAQGGHYFSYVKKSENEWYYLNDTGVRVVTTAIMRNDANGSEDGTTGYILLYERLDAAGVHIDVEYSEEQELIREITNDNVRLIVDKVYFSEPFAHFMMELPKLTGEWDIAFTYWFKVLSHSTLVNCWRETCEELAKPENMEKLVEYITKDVSVILDIMMMCKSAEMRIIFSDLIKNMFISLPPDNEVIILMISNLVECTNLLLMNWRNTFDYFKIWYDFASIDDERRDLLYGFEVGDTIMHFVTDELPNFVANKDNKITRERFCRQCDMTYIMKCFMVFNPQASDVLAPKCLRWLAGSEHHTATLIEMFQHFKPGAMNTFVDVLSATATAPSENLIAELIKYDGFICPTKWLERYFGDPGKRKHLLRAVMDKCKNNPELFVSVVRNQKAIMFWTLYAEMTDVREEAVGLLRVIRSQVPNIGSALFPLIEECYNMSTALYATSPDYKVNYLSNDCFKGLQLLQYLVELSVTMDDLTSFTGLVERTLHSILSIGAVRDEHSVQIAQIGCQILKKIDISPSFLEDIQTTIGKMYPDHKNLDEIMRNYLTGVLAKDRLGAAVLLPEGKMQEVMFKCLFTSKPPLPTSKRLMLNLFEIIGERYAGASRVIKVFAKEMVKSKDNITTCDLKNVIKVLSSFDKSAVDVLHKFFTEDTYVLRQLLSVVRHLQNTDEYLPKAMRFMSILMTKESTTVNQAIAVDNHLLAPFFRIVSQTNNSDVASWGLQCIIAGLPHINMHSFPTIYEHLICPSISLEAANDFIHLLMNIASTILRRGQSPPDFLQQKLAAEIEAVAIRSEKLSDMRKIGDDIGVLFVLSHPASLRTFVASIAANQTLDKLLSLEPSDGVSTSGFRSMLNMVHQSNQDKFVSLLAVAIEERNELGTYVLSIAQAEESASL